MPTLNGGIGLSRVREPGGGQPVDGAGAGSNGVRISSLGSRGSACALVNPKAVQPRRARRGMTKRRAEYIVCVCVCVCCFLLPREMYTV